MTYRDDHEAALRRAEAAERDVARIGQDNARLAGELDRARQWLGAPRRRALALAGAVIVAGGSVGVGIAIARTTTPLCPVTFVTREAPAVAGVLSAEGPELHGWTLVASQCVDAGSAVQIHKQGDELDMLWLSRSAVEIESELFDARLDAEACAVFAYDLTWTADGYRGYLAVDCQLGPNRVHGRIAFTRCG